jgi:hypothetical protein
MHRAEEEVVAVRAALGCARRADRPAGAGHVLDQELLAQVLAQDHRKRPAEGVDAATRGERIDQGDRLRRPVLAMRGKPGQQDRAGKGDTQLEMLQESSRSWLFVKAAGS